jgi:Histidine kinase-, DNA gyrase B-, and HSP90-like ATPase
VSVTHVTIVPSAGRLMTSLRDIGYDLPSAVADLVDNAIDANAEHVALDLLADGADSWLRVADDGLGMSHAKLEEAMRYGTDVSYAPRSLGHFGLGLKTASLSKCRRLTVASRERTGRRTSIRRWDLDTVLRHDGWTLERVPAAVADRRLTDPIREAGHGTVVLWQNLDRVLPRKPTAGITSRVLTTAERDIREHLAMVFHRFLSGEAYAGRSRLRLTLNAQEVGAWDPFATDEQHTRALPEQELEYDDSDGRTIRLAVQPFVLPAQELFSSTEAHRRAGGPQRWNRHQGFYVYRRDRLIQAGGWCRLRTLDEHAKLARIAVELPVGEEDRFAVDVAKMRVSIPEELRPGLRAIASGAVAVAQERYREHLHPDDNVDTGTVLAAGADAISVSRDWPAIMAVVEDVLGHDIELRDRLLLRLSNADPAAVGLEHAC